MKKKFIICSAYRILLVGEIGAKMLGESCSTYTGYRNKDRVQELINNNGRGLDLSGPGFGGKKHCNEQGNFFRSLETTGCFL